MAYEFRHTRRVEFCETDMAGIVHFAVFFRYMEAAEHAFYRSLGLTAHEQSGGRARGWPRVEASCRYMAPLRFEDEVEVRLLVREKGRRSLAYDFVFRKAGEGPGVEVARGSMTVVFVTMDAGTGPMASAAMPAAFDGRIEVAPAELLEGGAWAG